MKICIHGDYAIVPKNVEHLKKMNYSDFSCGSQWEHKTVAAVVVSSPALLLPKSTQDQPQLGKG